MIDQHVPALRPIASCIRSLVIPPQPDTAVEEHQTAPDPEATKQFVRTLEACVRQDKRESDPPDGEPEIRMAGTRPGRTCPLSPDELQEFDRVVGERLAKARELNGYNQIAAARRLGYATPAPLSKIEAGQPAPAWLLPRAAAVFGVSSDYLFGISNYPERDSRTVEQIAILRTVRAEIETNARRVSEAMILAAGDEVAATAHAEELCGAVLEVSEALANCREHPSFDDEVIGGARLVRAVAAAQAMAETALKYLARREGVRAVLSQYETGKTAPASISEH